ncbi:MAG TPA: hypothetical protein VK610_08395, partial [Rhodothermales bacterium]|nr:hypothetical protein [Rhodothermales bacterium]
MSSRLPSLLVLAFALAGAGCVPYAVGTTAAVAPRNEIVPSGTLSFVPVAIDTAAYGGAVSGGSLVYADAAAHVGLSERAEIDVRFPGLV